MIRTNVVTLTVIPAIAYRQKLPSGGSGITIYRYDTVQPGIASISKSTGKAIPAANTSRKLFPQKAFSEAIELTAGLPYKKQKGVRVAEEKVVEVEDTADEAVAAADAAVIDSADYEKIVSKFTDKKGKLSYDLLNRELIKYAKKSAQVRSMIESKATADEICFEIAKAKFKEITGNALLSDDQIRKAIELLDEVSPKGVFKELNSEIRLMLKRPTAKTAAAKKPAAKAPATAKPATKTAKAVTAPKETVKIQFGADEYDFAEIKKAVDADCKSKVKGKIKSIEIYIKPEDKAVYYVVNGDFSDKIDL